MSYAQLYNLWNFLVFFALFTCGYTDDRVVIDYIILYLIMYLLGLHVGEQMIRRFAMFVGASIFGPIFWWFFRPGISDIVITSRVLNRIPIHSVYRVGWILTTSANLFGRGLSSYHVQVRVFTFPLITSTLEGDKPCPDSHMV